MSNQTTRPKPGALYVLGILCFIPVLGFIAGVVFLTIGIIYYKDKWFSLMGVFGIVWTIACYATLFYVGFHSSVGRQGFADLSQSNLNSLVGEIEFYKVQHGHYPDKLEELKANNKFIFINDPTQSTFLSKTTSLYNYENKGDKYILFSSGVDNIPHTKDDLFPKITITDSSKIGLIKP
ncbi:hypothetical protein [Pinibacter aurantiacus]|uniref:Type II secretion system protein GspG C-terminal domain-containing protein n=1 Tax=Pinibacter aurantiacus TaxID=2851599 RepID=A0A9E2W3M1_9BACT|nr:hypothetical protein [Pinibacter aurantiacus]MBV4356418.1 hypothetical protein [Pinibacter aurantiacus]